ncbi:alpha/beta hydrolase [Purpureocillium lavendulum]|uniref:Alpha/beta hydrolase n=1 Tax=Purpureocillium lavendulum TaxID=1247861 RepID=A0AB34FUD2_9HYPO|nr:alpha/beta hydrolase [Purpureocillium lavendulum]
MLGFIVTCLFGLFDVAISSLATLTTRLIEYLARSAKSTESSADTTFATCAYRLDSSHPLTLILPDSRTISYAQFGSTSPRAKTIFFLHGWPGSRIEGTYLDAAAKAHNVRVLTIDRPGIGQSTADPDRTLLSHASDIDHVAQHLNVERYGILGVSGGGPYALACAKALPAEKLEVVSIVCGLGPCDIGYRGMYIMNYLGWTFAPHYTPGLLRWWFSREPTARLDLSRKERMDLLIKGFESSQTGMLPKDEKFFGDADVMKVQLRTGEEVNAQGSRFWLQDMKLLASDPGFNVTDIRKDLNIQLLYGKLDRNVPLKHGEEIARRLNSGRGDADERVTLKVKEHDTHASVFFDYREDIIRDMAAAMAT